MVSFEHTVLFSFSFNHIKSFATHYVLIFISLTLAACFFFTSLLLKAQFPFFSLQHIHKHTLYSLDSLPLCLIWLMHTSALLALVCVFSVQQHIWSSGWCSVKSCWVGPNYFFEDLLFLPVWASDELHFKEARHTHTQTLSCNLPDLSHEALKCWLQTADLWELNAGI